MFFLLALNSFAILREIACIWSLPGEMDSSSESSISSISSSPPSDPDSEISEDWMRTRFIGRAVLATCFNSESSSLIRFSLSIFSVTAFFRLYALVLRTLFGFFAVLFFDDIENWLIRALCFFLSDPKKSFEFAVTYSHTFYISYRSRSLSRTLFTQQPYMFSVQNCSS